MIPKVIHYCWFGGKELPEQVKWYISTWRKYCPDYKIIEWNESNFEVNQNLYCKEAYEAKKWAFVSDYARLKILYDHGGIYMDTDVEVCKNLDEFLQYAAFSGYESYNKIPTGTIGAVKHNNWIKHLLSYYETAKFLKDNGEYNFTTNVEVITKMTVEKYNINLNNKFILFDNIAIYPFEVFCAKDFLSGNIYKSSNTYTIHNFNGSWLSKKEKNKIALRRILIKIFGDKIVCNLFKCKNYIRRILCVK